MKFIVLLSVFFISACSLQIVEMTPEPTAQEFDLTDADGQGDGDGIITARDKCPNTKLGAKVGNDGCGSEAVYTVRHRLDVNFDKNSDVVKAEYFPQIEQLAKFMTDYPNIQVTIEGHTSIRGSAKHNLALSNNRALAIKALLTKQYNIAEERVNTVGYGFEKLLLEGNDEFSHEKNRRIVAEISSDVNFSEMKWTIYSVDNELE